MEVQMQTSSYELNFVSHSKPEQILLGQKQRSTEV